MDKLSYIIRELLIREEKAFLPGIGVITMQRKGSEIDAAKGQIHPPKDEIDFLPSTHIQPEHFEQQVDRLDLPGHVDLGKLKLELIQALTALSEGHTHQIGEWLTLHKRESGNFELHFSEDVKISPIDHLPVLSMPAPVASGTASDEILTEPAPKKSSKKTINWKVPAILTAIVLLLSFILWWYTPEWRNAEDSFTKLLVKERVNVSPSKVISEDTDKKEKVLTKPFQGMKKTPLMGAEEGLNADSSVGDPAEEKTENNSEPQASDTEITPGSELSLDDCVIVVGSFSRSSNVKKMKDRLENKGHKIFTQSINGLTRVGLYTSCEEDPLDSVLSETRKNIEEAAWLLEE